MTAVLSHGETSSGTSPIGSDALSRPVVKRPKVIIGPRKGFTREDLKELVRYKDLFLTFTWRSIRVRYAQSALGLGWAIIQPLFQMVMFTLVFGYLAKMPSDDVPYALFSLVALIPWTYFSNAVQDCSGILVANSSMISKVYFPRLILPLSAVTSKLFDFGIALSLATVCLMLSGVMPTSGLIMVPWLIGIMAMTALGVGLWLTTLAVQYRDIGYAMGFIVQLMMYANPVVYSTSLLPETYVLPGGLTIWPQTLYALNPMVGVIEGFRSAYLGTRPMPMNWILMGTVTSLVLVVTGVLYFRSRERLIADVS